MRLSYLSGHLHKALCSGAAMLLVAFACNLVWAGAGPPPPPPPPKTDPLADPNADQPLPGAENEPVAKAVPATAPTATATVAASSGPADPAVVEKGHSMYRDYCQKCHGLNMVSPGGGFFDLRTFPHDDKARFVNSVTNGKRAMPAWGAILKPTDIDTVWAYISSGGAAPH